MNDKKHLRIYLLTYNFNPRR